MTILNEMKLKQSKFLSKVRTSILIFQQQQTNSERNLILVVFTYLFPLILFANHPKIITHSQYFPLKLIILSESITQFLRLELIQSHCHILLILLIFSKLIISFPSSQLQSPRVQYIFARKALQAGVYMYAIKYFKNQLNQILSTRLFIRKYIFMSNTWKALNKSSASSAKGKLTKSNKKKYTPLLQDNESVTSNRFRNQTLSRNQSEIMSQMAENKLITFNEKQGEVPIKDRVLKSSASQLRLKSDIFSTYEVKVSKGRKQRNDELGSERSAEFTPQKGVVHWKLAQDYKKYAQEIKQLKSDFLRFQNSIMSELRKQEKIIERVLQGVIVQVNKCLMTSPVKILSLDNILSDIDHAKNQFKDLRVKLEEESEKSTPLIPPPQRYYSPRNKVQAIVAESCPSEKASKKSQKEVHRQRPSFDKFMIAMRNLKQGMAEISHITDIGGIKSPRGSMENRKIL